VAHVDRAARGSQLVAVAVLPIHGDLHLLEGGQPARDRVLKLKLALLVEHHQGHRGDRLGHRSDPKDRVVLDWQGVLGVAVSVRLDVHDLPVSSDERERTRDQLLVDVPLHHRSDARKALARHADLARLGARKGIQAALRHARLSLVSFEGITRLGPPSIE
jgi:hypothetical protein